MAAKRAPALVSQLELSRGEPVADLGEAHGGIGSDNSIEGLLDEEFDDLGCDLHTLLRLANSA